MPESRHLLTCRRCTIRYAWASDYLELESERDRYRVALEEIASYQEHGRHSAITPSVLARRAQQALDDEALSDKARRAM